MSFWGAIVPKRENYTLQLDGYHKRVRITHATLGDCSGLSNACSKLKCALGSKPPLYICALTKEQPYRRLDLEFEESDDEVVFSIRGPQEIHLSGYYVPQSAVTRKLDKSTSTDDLSSIDPCIQENKVVAGSKEAVVVDAGNAGGSSLAAAQGNGHILENTEMHQDGIADDNKAEDEQDALYAFDTELPEEIADDYVLCIRKTLTPQNNLTKTVGKHAADNLNKTKPNTSVLEENTAAIREVNQQSDTLLPSITEDAFNCNGIEENNLNKSIFFNMLMRDPNAKQNALDWLFHLSSSSLMPSMEEKDNNKMQGDEGNFDEVDTGCYKDAMDEVKGPNAHSKTDALHHLETCKNQIVDNCNANVEIKGLEASAHEDIVEKPKDTMTNGDVKVLLTTTNSFEPTNSGIHSKDGNEEGNFDHNLGNICHVKVEELKRSSDKIGEENSKSSPEEEDETRQGGEENDYMAEEERAKKKKHKTEATDHVIPCKSRTLSNGMIIEDVAMGKLKGKKAAPGIKVKIFYTARLRDTGDLLCTNVGENPFKFRLGDKKIIKGLNIGVDGMRIGGKRRLIIPPEWYGKKLHAHLPPNSWVIFDTELVSIQKISKENMRLRQKTSKS